jgi:hypothetical protein
MLSVRSVPTAGPTPAALAGWALAAGILAVLAGWGATLSPLVTAVAAAVAVVVALAFLPLRAAVTIVVLAAFASRLTLDIGGFAVRPEHAATLLLTLVLVRRGRLRHLLMHLAAPPTVFLVAYTAYAGVATAAFAPSFMRSASILAWLALDCLLLGALLCARPSHRQVYDCVAWATLATSVLAIAAWLSATATGSGFGVQRGLDNPAPAAFGLSLEANLFAGLLVLSSIALLSGPKGPRSRLHFVAAVAALAALPTTQTRAAVLAFGAAALLIAVRARGPLRRAFLRTLGISSAVGAGLIAAGVVDARPLLAKFANVLDFADGNGAYRVQIARLALGDMDSWSAVVFGLGTNTFGQRHFDPSRPGQEEEAYLGTLPLQIFYDTGLIGVALITLLVVCLARRARGSAAAWPVLLAYFILSSATSALWLGYTWVFVALAATHAATARPRAAEAAASPGAVRIRQAAHS